MMMIPALQAFWVQLYPIIIEVLIRSADLFIAPIRNTDLIWALFPVYINWILVDFLSTKVEFSNAATTGFTYLWVGTNWLREYFKLLELRLDVIVDSVTVNISKFLAVANPIELGIVLAMFVYGLVTMWFSVTGREIGKFMGDVRTMAFVLIVLTPILFRTVPFDIITINAILFSALVFYTVTEIIYRTFHPSRKAQKEEKD